MSDTSLHREVERHGGLPTWPADQPFPLTPLECWYLMQGWKVRPKVVITRETFDALPPRLEMVRGVLNLVQRQ